MPYRPTHRLLRLHRLAGVVLATVLLVSAAPGRFAAAQETDAAALLKRSAGTMAKLDSFHFALTTPRGKTLFMENLELSGVEGDVLRPDSFRATATAKAAIISLDVRVVGIGTRLWVTDPTAQQETYIEVDLAEQGAALGSITDLINPDRVLLEAVKLIEQPTIVDEDDLDGVHTTLVEGTFDLGKVGLQGTPIPGLKTGDPLPVTIWIDDEGRVRRMELDGPLTDAEAPNVTRRLELSAFDDPVEITPPV